MPHEIVVAILLLITGQTVLATTSADRQQDSNSGSGDDEMKSMNIELIKLSILNKLGMQRPPEFGNRLHLQGQLKKYNNNSGSSTVTPPQFRNRSYRINATGNDTINSHNDDDDDDYHVQTQKLIAFTQPHPTMQNFQGQFPLYFTFSDPTRHFSITKAILWVYKRQLLDVIIDDSVIIIDVYKMNPNNLQQLLVSSVKQVFNTTEPGWVPIELKRNMSDWFKTVDGAKNLTLVVQAYYLNKNTTHDKIPYITDARKREDNMTEDCIDYLPKTKYKIDFIHLNMLIKTENWDTYLNSTSIDESFEKFNLKINEFINLSSSKYIVNNHKNNNKKLKDWITNGLTVSIRKRNHLACTLKKRPFDKNFKLKYIKYRNLLTHLIKKAKLLHYQNKISNAGNDVKKLWNIIKEVSGKKTNIYTINQIRDNSGNLITNNVEICNIFNKHFSKVGPTIENNIKSSGFNFKPFEYLN
ncbi:growth/differentiation factor 8-like isoform X2, partial [Aphis craccivora]